MLSNVRICRQTLNIIFGNHNYHNLAVLSAVQHNPKIQNPIFKRFNQNKPLKCWQCGIERKNIAELFCEQCNYIQGPLDKKNYFKIFEIPENFMVDSKQLTSKYRKLQSVLHPDKFSTKSDQEKNISEEFSSLVNKAYDVLQSPLKRALHLLALRGGKIDENQKIQDPAFLMEIMELNEEVENADTSEKLINLKRKNERELEKIASDVRDSFINNDIEKAKEYIIKMKYYNSVNVHINSIMREKGVVE